MSVYVIRKMPDGLLIRAKTKARELGASLDAVVIAFLESYAQHGSIPSLGAKARNASLTREERVAAAKHAIAARWARPRRDPPP